MSPEAAAADQVYRLLKVEIMGGRYSPTAVLNVQAIANGIGVSISPVRDAMERLVGERLLATRPAGGFQMPHISEEGVRDLYLWHGFLVRGALRGRRSFRRADELAALLERTDPEDSENIVALTAEYFYRLVEAQGNVEHLFALRSAGDRLHSLRLRESRLKNRRSELRNLLSLANSGGDRRLRDAVDAYHRRRLRQLRGLVEGLYLTSVSGNQGEIRP